MTPEPISTKTFREWVEQGLLTEDGTLTELGLQQITFVRDDQVQVYKALEEYNRCPCSFPHAPHDYCDGSPAPRLRG
jgi:hypothetical protein